MNARPLAHLSLVHGALVLCALVLFTGCTREREEILVPLPSDLAPPSSPLEARIRERAPREASTLVPAEDLFEADYTEGQSRYFSAVLHDGGFCYKVLAQGDDAIEDLDILVFDPNNVLQQRDTSEGREAAVGGRRAICPEQPGLWRIEIVASRGAGRIAAQLWMTP